MIYWKELSLQTKGFCDIINISSQAEEAVSKSGFSEGLLTAFVTGSTASVTTIEYEPGLIEDLQVVLERLIPTDGAYAHNQAWGDGNGFSHLRASILGPGITVPLRKGKLILGTWQQIVVIDFDNHPRKRTVVLQVVGEKNRDKG